ncbi:antA/AntB antirepressor family protein [Riemerella anatipestifer]|uniref:antA/AntB antirepressor family protein n=1 Tax=Riemerella anatipestifer TaxID=34085 RepID=UPI002A8AEC27|nr:antA/AntB antirepressor family protein [Riemerella anatipestifer]
MNQLIKITEKNGNSTVSAKDLHQFLGSNEQFGKWIKRMLGYGYVQGIDFEHLALLVPTANGGHVKSKDYVLTLDTAKEIAMLQRSKKGREIRRYFIEVEKAARKQMLSVPQPKTYNGVKCIHYTSWLIQNGYSLMSGQVRARIKKYPEQFRKTKDGWYMSEAISEYYLNFKNPKERIAALPSVNPNQLTFNFQYQ